MSHTQYLKSLKVHKGHKSVAGGKKNREKPISFDTFVEDESKKDLDVIALEDAAKLEVEKLKNHYSWCVVCGPDRMCKID